MKTWMCVCGALMLLVGATAESLAATPAPNAAAKLPAAVSPQIRYDVGADKLTVQLEDASLLWALGEVMRQTGVDFRADPAVERKLSIEFRDMPLETAIERLTDRLNTIKSYKEGGKDKAKKGAGPRLLVSVTVLPQGKVDASAAVRLMESGKEMDMRAALSARRAQEGPGRADAYRNVNMRWQARLDGMSADDRARYQKKLADQEKKQSELAEARKKNELEREQQRVKRMERLERAAAEREKSGPRPKPAYDPALAEKARQQFAQPKTPAVIPGPEED